MYWKVNDHIGTRCNAESFVVLIISTTYMLRFYPVPFLTQEASQSAGIALSLHEALTMVRALGQPEEGAVGIIRLVQSLAGGSAPPPEYGAAPRPIPAAAESGDPAGGYQAWRDQRGGPAAEPAERPFFYGQNDFSDQVSTGYSDYAAVQQPPMNMRQEGKQQQQFVPSKMPAAYQPSDALPRSSMGRVAGPFVGVHQPGSLWQTTNRAIGGIHR